MTRRDPWTEHSRQTFTSEEEAETYARGMREVIVADNLVGRFATSTEQVTPNEYAAILWRYSKQ